jgi:hypothetical protein
MIRSVDMQIWPEFWNAPNVAAPTAWSTSASASTRSAFFPPSSSTAGLRFCAAWTPIIRPTFVDPVKLTSRTRGSAISVETTSAAVLRSSVTRFSTPAGRPASVNTSARNSPHEIGASSLGFITTVFPTASGIAMARMPRMNGAFHGEIAARTPSGTRWRLGGTMCAIVHDVRMWAEQSAPAITQARAAYDESSASA